MNTERRSLLKMMTLGGLAGIATSYSSLALARDTVAAPVGTIRPTLALVSYAAAESGFVRGIAASAAAQVVKAQRTGLGIDFILDLEQRLRSGQPQRLIGLTDDASGTLILDLARSAGARVQWLGQHHVNATAARHQRVSADAVSGCAARLDRALNSCPDGSARPGNAVEWSATLGYLLATLGASDTGAIPPFVHHAAPLTGNFVSFSIEA